MNKEMKNMHDRMTDPDLLEKKELENKHKKNVEQATNKYGLG